MKYGFIRVAAAVPVLKVAHCEYNTDSIIRLIGEAENAGAQFVVFPELSITAYTCGDLFHQQALLKEAYRQLGRILEATAGMGVVALIGLPVYSDNQLFNCAAVIQSGRILGIVPKICIPGYSEYYEERWFSSGLNALRDTVRICDMEVPFGTDLLFESREDPAVCFGIEICEDLWVPIPPSSYQAIAGATILFNLSASNEVVGKQEYRRELVKQQSGKCFSGYVYTSSGVHESTTDLVFSGHALIAENGTILAESERFSRDEQLICTEIDIDRLIIGRRRNTSFMEILPEKKYRRIGFNLRKDALNDLIRKIESHPFVPSDTAARDERCREILTIQASALAKRMDFVGAKHAVIGISGGLDSTLALLVTARAFDLLGLPRENIYAITMPGFGTTGITYNNAMQLIKAMGVTADEIDIKPACLQHFKDIHHDPDIHDVTYENVQARERYQILFDIANKIGGLVVGTGDMSELALGWCTFNGDQMSMYSVNGGVPKTLVRFILKWAADNILEEEVRDIIYRILDTPISPELLPPGEGGEIRQRTEDIIGPYELHDFFLYHMIRYGAPPKKILFLAEKAFAGIYGREEILKWLKVFYKRFFSQQYKRSCLPDGPKVGTVSLSPRGDWRMPSDAEAALWLKELDEINYT